MRIKANHSEKKGKRMMDRIVRWKINREKNKVKKKVNQRRKQTKKLIIVSMACFIIGIIVGINRKAIVAAALARF